jgi:hypothetical protein
VVAVTPAPPSASLDLDAVETVALDSFTRLVDVRGPTRGALAEHVDDPDADAFDG